MENAPEKSMELTPAERDTYMMRMMIVRFQRDAGGKVTGFMYSNPVAKGLRFTRVGDLKTSIAAASSAASAPSAGSATPKLDAMVGEYEMGPGRTLVVTLENGQLYGEPTANPKRPLVHISGTTFGVERADAPMTVTFTFGPDGRATTLVMKRDGQERILKKIK
jgi:hypothetical protein